jgi:hypothetical protein
LAQGDWRTLIKEDSQRVRFSIGAGSGLDQTVFSLFQNSDDLFMSDTRKPFLEFLHSGPTLEVLEQRSHGHTGSLKHPDPTDLSGNALDRATLTPVQHRRNCTLLITTRQGLLRHVPLKGVENALSTNPDDATLKECAVPRIFNLLADAREKQKINIKSTWRRFRTLPFRLMA